ncbi:hypothetical protein RUM43_010389 [Polyplax serrata]|uniref:Uncharacterized protein n=1 Tax=Polyplax serrata TaxID=468196 RepID=A0AAN8PKH0_POLSC
MNVTADAHLPGAPVVTSPRNQPGPKGCRNLEKNSRGNHSDGYRPETESVNDSTHPSDMALESLKKLDSALTERVNQHLGPKTVSQK